MKKIPFFKRILVKVLLIVTVVLSTAFVVNFIITTQNVDERMERNLIDKFNVAQQTTENFIGLIAQVSQIWAKEIALSHLTNLAFEGEGIAKIDALMKNQKNIVSADTILLLDQNGMVLSQSGSSHRIGDSLSHYDIVNQTLQTKKPVTKIARERESLILYSSAIINQRDERVNLLLIGYFMNDVFLENIKKNTNLEIALIGNSAVMGSTKWGDKTNLDILPINYLHYQNLLKNENRFKEITYKGKTFIVSAKRLDRVESMSTASLLFGYPYDRIKDEEYQGLMDQLVFLGMIFFISYLIIFSVAINYLSGLNRLSKATLMLSDGSTYDKVEIHTNDELELLADSFNTMAVELNVLHSNMQREIEFKTEALQSLNDDLEKRVAGEVEKNREKDKQLLQQSRMAQMGEMMSMIAHQWRQPLTAISATSSLLELKAKMNKLDQETVEKKAKEISSYSQHLSHTIDDFRDFFKPNKELSKTNYDEIVQSVLGMIEISITNKNIVLHQELNCHGQFSTYPNELKQVLLNLIKNAEEVLLEEEVKDPYIKIETYQKNEKHILEVGDNGGGIPEKIINKIFDPYFSTKGEKNGTGLGLYMSKTIINEHCGGELRVKNGKDGAIFEIELPNSRRNKK